MFSEVLRRNFRPLMFILYMCFRKWRWLPASMKMALFCAPPGILFFFEIFVSKIGRRSYVCPISMISIKFGYWKDKYSWNPNDNNVHFVNWSILLFISKVFLLCDVFMKKVRSGRLVIYFVHFQSLIAMRSFYEEG